MSTNKLNVEIKAKCSQPEKLKRILQDLNADFKGVDHQVDTYFNCPNGRLKLRKGNIENSLIFYQRSNQAGPKTSKVVLEVLSQDNQIRDVLAASHGILVEVDKMREIIFIENVKFHIDEVQGLGLFMEIEAIDSNGTIKLEKLQEQCQYYMQKLEIQSEDLIEISYSDLLLKK